MMLICAISHFCTKRNLSMALRNKGAGGGGVEEWGGVPINQFCKLVNKNRSGTIFRSNTPELEADMMLVIRFP